MVSRYRWSGSGQLLGSERPRFDSAEKPYDRRRRFPRPQLLAGLQISGDSCTHRRRLLEHGKHTSKKPTASYLALHPLSPLERLPTELLHRIFYEASCPAFSAASLSLAYVFQSRHLQFQYLHGHPEDLSSIITMRFFTPAFLGEYEKRYGIIDASDSAISPSLSAAPWHSEKLLLLRTLISRGASCAQEVDHHRENLRSAIRQGYGDEVAMALVSDSTFRPDSASIETAIKCARDTEGGLRLCTILVDAGGVDVSAINIWKAALSRGEHEFVQFLLTRTAPPAEVLGQLNVR